MPAVRYPTRYITLVVPFGPGDPPDIYARLIAAALTDVLGQQVIVENRSGAAGTIGTASVAGGASDGYTLLLAEITFVVGPNLFANRKYVPLRDFVPVVSLSRANMFLVVNPSFPAKTVSELVAMAKQRPGELQYVNPGSGTPPHLAALAFTRATSTVMAPISYQGPAPPWLTSWAGHVPIIFLGRARPALIRASFVRSCRARPALIRAPVPSRARDSRSPRFHNDQTVFTTALMPSAPGRDNCLLVPTL
jgi:tripartite-type tricarboxylate transporter receptor subunit TctC